MESLTTIKENDDFKLVLNGNPDEYHERYQIIRKIDSQVRECWAGELKAADRWNRFYAEKDVDFFPEVVTPLKVETEVVEEAENLTVIDENEYFQFIYNKTEDRYQVLRLFDNCIRESWVNEQKATKLWNLGYCHQ